MKKRADRWTTPIRWAIFVTVLGALGGVLALAVRPSTGLDTAMPVIIGFGLVGGAIGGIRFFLMPWGGAGDPRLGGDFDDGPIWTGYASVAGDYLRALGVWFAGAVPLGLLVASTSGDGTAVWVFPLILGLVWSIAYGIALLATGLIAIPVVILVRAHRARRAGQAFNPWWYFMAIYLLVLLAGVAALIALLVLTPSLLGVAGDDLTALLLGLAEPGQQPEGLSGVQSVALWVVRVLAVIMAVGMVVALVLASRRMREVLALGAADRPGPSA